MSRLSSPTGPSVPRIAHLRNLGPATERQLAAVGIATPAELERVGTIEAYRRLKRAAPRRVSVVMLWALEGALLGVHWNALPDDLREQLRAAADRMEQEE